MFGMKAQKIEKLFWKCVEIAAPLVKALYVREINKDDFESHGIPNCTHFPMIHHLTDATVVQINRPAGDHGEAKPYFSGEFLFELCRIF